jgi:hypothetical protein
MRAFSTATLQVVEGSGRSEHLKIEVKDSGGSWRDLGSYPGFNSVVDAEWGENVDDPHATARITLFRDLDDFSIAPLVDGAVNRAFNPGGSFSALLALNREIRISLAVMPADVPAASTDYGVFFHGRIDTIDWGSEQISIDARDLGGKLADAWIEEERVYAFAEVAGSPVSLRIWAPSTSYAVGDYVIPTVARRDVSGAGAYYFYKCTTAGVSNTTEPTWPTSGGGTVTDNTAIFTQQGSTNLNGGYNVQAVMQNMLDDWLGAGAVTLYTPTSPGWAITQYLQSRTSLLEALRTLALQIGWDIRYKWRAGTSQFELTLAGPDRAKASPDRTFSAADYSTVSGLKLDKSGIRNVVRVVYSDAGTPAPTGAENRKYVEVSDSTSITTYGRLFMEIAEASTSHIDSSSEATTMANAALSDCKDPKVEQAVEMVQGFPWAELGDLYRFSANGWHYTTDQDLALYSVRHTASDGRLKTTFECRGQPSTGFDRWHEASGRENPEDVHSLSVFEAGRGIALGASSVPVVGGIQLTATMDSERIAYGEELEWHVSQSSGFTPSAATLVTVSTSREITISDLIPGGTYYGKIVPRIRNGRRVVRAQQSGQVTFVAGRGNTAHLTSDAEWGRMPINGGFETTTNSGAVPDHWEVVDGTWGTHFTLQTGSGGVSGGGYLRMESYGVAQKLRSDLFPIVEDGLTEYRLEILAKNISGSGTWRVQVEMFAEDKTTSAGTHDVDVSATTNVGTWKRYGTIVDTASARWARVVIYKPTSTDTMQVAFDDVAMRQTKAGEQVLSTPSSSAKSTTSSTFANVDSYSTFPHRKGDERYLAIASGSLFSDGASTKAEIRITFAGTNFTAYPVYLNEANEHQQFCFAWYIGQDFVPETAGDAVVELQWRRVSGTGTVQMDSNDSYSLAIIPLP